MHCEINDRYFNVFFVKMQLKKEELENAFRAPELGNPRQYTGLSNGLICHTAFVKESKVTVCIP